MIRLRHALPLLLAFAATVKPLRGQERVVVSDVGPGISGRLLQQALARPHRVFPPAPDTAVIAATEPLDRTAIVLARTAIVEGTVRGDVFVVGGDLHVHPGAHITGRAVAIGGGVYPSTLAFIDGGTTSFRDHTFSVAPVDGGWSLAYRPLDIRPGKPFSLPGLYGLRIPAYDRTNGLSIPIAPMFTLDSGRIELEPGITYRSNLGHFDPSLDVRLRAGRRTRFEARAERGSFTNERWILSDLVNSLGSVGLGADTRNWWRADRGELRAFRLVEGVAIRMEPFIGARVEKGWSVGPLEPPAHTPWSLFGRHDEDGMERPNPEVDPGTITSALLGSDLSWALGPATLSGNALIEAGRHRELGRGFTQATLGTTLSFPVLRNHRFDMETHLVLSAGDSAPRQRYAWLGGTGTVPTMLLLEQGGDQLLFVESRYSVPIERIQLPIVGAPTVTLRHILGGAAVHRFPTLTQNVGLRVGLGFVRVDAVMDPVKRKTHFGASLSIAR